MANAAPDPYDLNSGTPPVVGAALEGEIKPKPKSSIGLSKTVLWGLFGIGVAFLVIFMLAIDKVEEKSSTSPASDKKEAEAPKPQEAGVLPPDLKSDKKGAVTVTPDVPASDNVAGSAGSMVPTDGAVGAPSAGGSVVPQARDGKPMVPGVPASGTVAQANVLTPEQQRLVQAKQSREDRMSQARLAGLEVRSYRGGDGAGSSAATASEGGKSGVAGSNGGAGVVGGGLIGGRGGPGAGANESVADQDQKLKFWKDGGNAPTEYHASTVLPPASPFQLNAGSFIPSILEMSVNSDLPGVVTARVRENVYASIRHNCLLIPSATKLFGSYDSRVAIGQARQLVVWNRATFPNGYELNLAGMPTADVEGGSGLGAEVDNHWLRLFGVALGMSAVTAGVQLSVHNPQTTSSNGVVSQPSYAQTVSTALAQQFGQLGGQIMGKYLNVQPTLRNYPGERFNIIVPRSIVFPGCYQG